MLTIVGTLSVGWYITRAGPQQVDIVCLAGCDPTLRVNQVCCWISYLVAARWPASMAIVTWMLLMASRASIGPGLPIRLWKVPLGIEPRFYTWKVRMLTNTPRACATLPRSSVDAVSLLVCLPSQPLASQRYPLVLSQLADSTSPLFLILVQSWPWILIVKLE